jgi:hypothetical protein
MNNLQKKAIELAKDVKDLENNKVSAPHVLWCWINQLQSFGLSTTTAAWVVRSWLSSGWVPPSVIAAEQQAEIDVVKEDMATFKKTMADMQHWYGKLDDFLKEKEKVRHDY